MKPVTTEHEAIAFLHQYINYEDPSARKKGPGFTLDGMRCLLEQLGHPEHDWPSIVVAGSKGKGSTCAMLASVLTHAGYTTGLYSQPHLHSWRERVTVDGQPLSPSALMAAVQWLQQVVPHLTEHCPTMATPTYYELGTAVGFLHFASQPVDIAVLEIGLGGRLDAVNVVTPLVSAITAISLEHTDVLGTTLEAIAGEKAGIIKADVPVVVGKQPPEAAAVIRERAAAIGAPVRWAMERANFTSVGDPAGPAALSGAQDVDLELPRRLAESSPLNHRVRLPLLGEHQLENATTAVALVEVLVEAGWCISADAIVDGLSNTRWPGRLEVLRQSPLLLADGAHNPESAARLREALARHFPGRRLTLVLGILSDKDIDGIAAELTPIAERVLVAGADSVRAAPAKRIAAAVVAAGGAPEIVGSVTEAVLGALATAGPDAMMCVTGSLMAVAEARVAAGVVDP